MSVSGTLCAPAGFGLFGRDGPYAVTVWRPGHRGAGVDFGGVQVVEQPEGRCRGTAPPAFLEGYAQQCVDGA